MPGEGREREAGLPVGSRDVLPREAFELREVETRLHETFVGFGYREVRTPALELDAVIDRADARSDAAYRLFDDRGQVLTLRPDPTIPVARLVATRLAGAPDPVRVSYFGTAYRPPTPGRPDEVELRQAGVELVGAAGPGADAEVVAVLRDALCACGLSGFRIVLGSVGLIEAVLAGLGLDDDQRSRLLGALRGRNHVAWRSMASELDIDEAVRDAVVDLPTLRDHESGLAELTERVPAARGAAQDLVATLGLLGRHGAGADVAIDLGVVRDRAYYSGIVIEAFADGVGAPIAMGGRYDAIAARFGRARPAVGVAVDIAGLHRASVAAGAAPGRSRSGVVLVDGLDGDLEAAAEARAAGAVVVAGVGGEDRACALAEADGLRYVARSSGEGFSVLDLDSGERFAADDLSALSAAPR